MNMLVNVLFTVLCGLLLLSVLVVVHEGGHYLAARACGVRVTEFFLGLPCRWRLSWRSRRHGTEFGVTPFMLGGYNRICGMEYSEDELLPQALAIVQREGRVSASALAGELGVDEDRAFALLIVLSDMASIRPYYDPELGEHPAQREYPEQFETLARDAGLNTAYDRGHDFSTAGSTADGEPRPVDDAAGLLERERARTYAGLGFGRRLLVLAAGPLVNLLLAFVVVTGLYLSMEYGVPQNVNVIGEVTEGSLAEAAGLEAGDVVLSVGGVEVDDWESLSAELSAAREAGADFDLVCERNGVERVVRVDLPEGQEVDLVGVRPPIEPYHLTLAEAMQGAVEYAGLVGSVAVRLIMPQHTMEVLDQSTSIVGISVMATQAVEAGLFDLLSIVAAVSMSLGFMNLLPIPPLDGGKMVLELVEVILRRPISMRARMAVSYVGIAFFVFVFVVVVQKDFARFLVG